ncbi:MAG: ZIP family metal transporter [Acholeplasmatales bacterium]|nr:ZIP family metal transporter [Acholeplasmatales bacterium]
MGLELVLSTKLILAILIPFIGTTLGSAMVFFLRKQLNQKILKILLGFASGVMISASFFSLLLPAIEALENYKKWLIPTIGFSIGIAFLVMMDKLIPHEHIDKTEEGIGINHIKKQLKLFLAIIIHNIPEGLAVGVIIASAINGTINQQAALTLSIGIAIQNFPEGAVVSMPLKETGISKFKAFMYGVFSGVVEPIAAIVAILLTSITQSVLPYALAFAAGAMIYVVSDELLPEAQSGDKSMLPTLGVAIGFVIMMVLDIALG